MRKTFFVLLLYHKWPQKYKFPIYSDIHTVIRIDQHIFNS
jgi:hypothetical protein